MVDKSNTHWMQVSLPIKYGGLDIRRIATIALSAFLASAASALHLQDRILAALAESLKSRREATFGPAPAADLAFRESSWDRPGILATAAKVEAAFSFPFQRACLVACPFQHVA